MSAKPTPLTYDDVFPWWESIEGKLQECDPCGAAVAGTEKHVDWHNSLLQAPRYTP